MKKIGDVILENRVIMLLFFAEMKAVLEVYSADLNASNLANQLYFFNRKSV